MDPARQKSRAPGCGGVGKAVPARESSAADASVDAFGRRIDYLRISVTDRCNERCLYCMPRGYRGWTRRPDQLSAAEIIRVARVAAGLGFRKFRLTGGEPMLRVDLPAIVQGIASSPGVECVGLSTNGTRLTAMARTLRAAGLRTVNVSLDALDPVVYREITGGRVQSVLDGLEAAVEAGFECIKLNCVLLRGVNEEEIWPLVRFAAKHGFPLRLIELMPLRAPELAAEARFLRVAEVKARLAERDELAALPAHRMGWGPAKYYRLKRTGAVVGFVGAMSDRRFCETCNKVRLTADGFLRPCLGDQAEIDLKGALREGRDDEAVRALFLETLRKKPLQHQFCERSPSGRPMTAIGG